MGYTPKMDPSCNLDQFSGDNYRETGDEAWLQA